jgi:FtsH-binding integral membrane protein
MSNEPKRTSIGWAPAWNGQAFVPQGTPPPPPPGSYVLQDDQFDQQPTQLAQPYVPQPPVHAQPPQPPQYQQQPYPQQPYPQQPYPQQPYPQYPQYPQAPYDQQQPQQPYYPPAPNPYPQSQPAQYGYYSNQPPQQPQPPYPSLLDQHKPPADQSKKAKAKSKPKVTKRTKSTPPTSGGPQLPTAAAQGRPIAKADATAGVSQRTRFIRLTYLHLFCAILAFAGLLYLLMTNDFLVEKVSYPFVEFALGGRWNWGVVLAAFMVVSFVADYWASHATSRGMQYLGLGFYVIAEAIIFVPLLAIVQAKTADIVARGGGDPNIIRDSAYVTLGIFTALTLSVFITKKDFSFLRSGLLMASGAAVMLIVLSLVFGFNLGIVFSVGMVLLAAAYILYQTSQVLAHYNPQQYVAASLALFSSVALMFWYVIRIFMRARE